MRSDRKKISWNLILLTGIPDQKNRAIYQRGLFLSKKFDLSIFTIKSAEVAPEIKKNARVYYLPVKVSLTKKLGFAGYIIEKILFSFWVFFSLVAHDNSIIYSFHRNGNTAAGLLKLIKGKRVRWIADMQHTPYYFFEASKNPKLLFLKRIAYMPLGIFYIYLGKLLLPKADLVVSMSYDYDEGFSRILNRYFKVPRKRLLPVPNGVDIELIDKIRHGGEKSKFDTLGNGFRFLYAGNVWPERLIMLKKILDNLRQYNMDVSLAICGAMSIDGKKAFEKIKTNYIAYFGLIPHIELLRLYKNIDVALIIIDSFMKDHNYSHPGKLFEALAMGKVVIVSDLSSVRKVVHDGYNGIILNKNYMEQACMRVLDILNRPVLKKQIQDNAMESIQFLDWSKLNLKWFSGIEKTLLKNIV